MIFVQIARERDVGPVDRKEAFYYDKAYGIRHKAKLSVKKKLLVPGFFLVVYFAFSMSFAESTCGPNYIPFFGPASSQKNFEMIELVMGEITFSPFVYACNGGVRKSEAPDFLQRSIPNADLHGNSAQDFIRLVAEKVKVYLGRNQRKSEKLLNCIDGENIKCEEGKIREIQASAGRARAYLASMQALEALNAPAVAGKSDFTRGSSAAPNGLSKEVEWDRYSEEEYRKALNTAKEMKKVTVAEVKKSFEKSVQRKNEEKEVAKVLELLRQNQLHEYRKIMTTDLSLQYVSSEKPSIQEIKNSLLQLEENRKMEESQVDDVIKSASQNRTTVDKDTLWILEYKLMVEETLIEHPEFCGLASSLGKLKANLFAHKNLMLLAGSLLVPPLAGYFGASALAVAAVAGAAGGVSSYYYIEESYTALQRAKRAARVGPDGDDSVNAQWVIDDADSDFKFQVVTAPLMFLGLPVGRLAKTADSSIKTSAEVFRKMNSSQAKKIVPK